jgi:hypothetical protein
MTKKIVGSKLKVAEKKVRMKAWRTWVAMERLQRLGFNRQWGSMHDLLIHGGVFNYKQLQILPTFFRLFQMAYLLYSTYVQIV